VKSGGSFLGFFFVLFLLRHDPQQPLRSRAKVRLSPFFLERKALYAIKKVIGDFTWLFIAMGHIVQWLAAHISNLRQF